MNTADEYKETVKRARAAESIADELAIWREFIDKTEQQLDTDEFRLAALARIAALKVMEASA